MMTRNDKIKKGARRFVRLFHKFPRRESPMKHSVLTRIPALLLSLCLVCSMFSIPVHAAVFEDVAEAHWAYDSVQQAYENGAVIGDDAGRFLPDKSVTEAELIAMLIRAFYPWEVDEEAEITDDGERFPPEVIDDGADDIVIDDADVSELDSEMEQEAPWYEIYLRAAEKHNLLDGVAVERPDMPLNRYDMAQMIDNLLLDVGVERFGTPQARVYMIYTPDWDEIPERYQDAVSRTYYYGILNGMDRRGTFGGENLMTRAQSAMVFCRITYFLDKYNLRPVEREVPPVEPVFSESEQTETLARIDRPLPEFIGEPTALVVYGQGYTLGESLDELLEKAGEPDEMIASNLGFIWYVFGTDDYAVKFFMAGVSDDRVVTLCSAGRSFDYLNMNAESVGAEDETKLNRYAAAYYDSTDNYRLHMVYLRDPTFMYETELTAETLYGESRVAYFLTNAFRVMHEQPALRWSGDAAGIARDYAEQIAEETKGSGEPVTTKDELAVRLNSRRLDWYTDTEYIVWGAAPGQSIGIHAYRKSVHNDTTLAAYDHLGIGSASGYGQNYVVEEYFVVNQEPEVYLPEYEELTVGGQTYSLEMSLEELIDIAGEPDETYASACGFDWYVFGADNYAEDFLLAGIYDDTVKTLCSAGRAFEYIGMTYRTGLGKETEDSELPINGVATGAYDKNDGYRLHMVYLKSPDFRYKMDLSEENLYHESLINRHMVNAFRTIYQLEPLAWDENCAEAGRLHAVDMAEKNYFAHTNLDGVPAEDRVTAQGVDWVRTGENIHRQSGYQRSIGVWSHAAFVFSTSHRETLIGNYNYVGVGAANSDYGTYIAEEFYA